MAEARSGIRSISAVVVCGGGHGRHVGGSRHRAEGSLSRCRHTTSTGPPPPPLGGGWGWVFQTVGSAISSTTKFKRNTLADHVITHTKLGGPTPSGLRVVVIRVSDWHRDTRRTCACSPNTIKIGSANQIPAPPFLVPQALVPGSRCTRPT